uniref:non-specific serine/threonine protein kinase n=1 Tax=Quercus lobata TaxID=97700 RepID=A0A7N2LJA0_QUELO
MDVALREINDSLCTRNRTLNLDWSTRFDICLGVAGGLAYLHEESQLQIVHRDVKASNILLDFYLVPKILDFDLAKLYDDKKTHISTRVAGTIGYIAPEYAMRGYLTEKADVFALGVVALEIVSGRPNANSSLEEEEIYLLEWIANTSRQNGVFGYKTSSTGCDVLPLAIGPPTLVDSAASSAIKPPAPIVSEASPATRPLM